MLNDEGISWVLTRMAIRPCPYDFQGKYVLNSGY